MEGILFYWLFWSFWIITTFFTNKKNPDRFRFSFLLLFVILLSLQSFSFWGYTVSISSVIILFAAYYEIGNAKRKISIYTFITSFIVMLAYTSFHLFELFDPVWILIDRKWMLSALLTYLAILLHNNWRLRLISVVAGSIQGDILYAIILKKFTFSFPIGTLTCLDILALSMSLILVWSGFERLAALLQYHFNHEERERQKLS